MDFSDYMDKSYHHTVADRNDTLTVHKFPSDDSATITMTRDDDKSSISIRSREQLEQLHFLLGQLLS